MSKAILRNTETFAAVKIWGAAADETIDLDTDLLVTNRLFKDGDTQTVNIISLTWSGAEESSIKITRDSTDIITLNGPDANELIFDNMGFNDNVNNTDDIRVQITGDAYLYISLRKAGGYSQSFEPEIFGPADDPTEVGS